MPDLGSSALRKHYDQSNDRTTSMHSARNDNRLLRKQQLRSGQQQQQQQLKEEINCCITMEAETTSGSSKCAKWWLQLATQFEQVSTLESSSSSEVDARSFKEQQHQCRSMELAAAASAAVSAIVDTSETRDVNQANIMHTTCASNCKIKQTTPTLTSTSRKQHNNHKHHLLMSCLVSLILVSCAISILDKGILQQLKFVECSPSTSQQQQQQQQQQQPISVVEKLKERGKQLTELGVKTGAAGQISDWFVNQVAPMVATKIIDNVLSTPSGGGGGGTNKKSKSLKQSESHSSLSSGSSLIDTHALADKIVDHLADSIKKRKSGDTKLSSSSSSSSANQVANDDLDSAQSISAGSSATSGAIHDHQSGKERAKPSGKRRSAAAAGASRRGKSLVSDSVQQVMQNLFSKDAQRTFFGRAMEKHSTRHTNNPLRHTSSSSSSSVGSGDRANGGGGGGGGGSSWMIAKEPVYEPHLFVNTDSSQLDENPVVLRAEHGHNSTTIPPPTIHYPSQQQQQQHQQQLLRQQQQQQYNNKLKLQQQQQNKYNSVHTNRHNQLQHLAPKPWQSSGAANQGGNNRRQQQQQSPYSLSVTSDINIVQAPSSPAPPPITSTSTQPTTTTTSTTSTTTTALPQPPGPQAGNNYGANGQQAHHQHHQITHIGTNKFKINNRHQFPSSAVAISPNSWSSSNHNSRHGINYQHQQHQQHQQQQHQHNQNHQNRYPLPSPSSTSTSTTTTTTTTSTTTTTTTTPEPVTPQTEPMMAENELMDSESEQPTQSSALSSSLSSVALLALDALGSSSSASSSSHHSSNQIDDNPYSPSSSSSSSTGNYNHQHSSSSNSNSSSSSSSSGYYKSPSSSSSSSGNSSGGATKSSSSALPSTTSARHSILSSEAIPTALGAPLYHLMQANYTTHSFIGSPLPAPSRRGGVASPVAKALGKYIQKGMNNLSSNIFSRQSKGWARRLGISSVLLSVLYGAAVLSNPGAPLPANGLDVIRALTKGLAKKRRGGTWSSSSSSPLTGLAPLDGPGADNLLLSDSQVAPQIATAGDIDRATNNAAAILDNNVFLLYQQQPHLMSIIEHLIQQEQLQHQQQQQQHQHQHQHQHQQQQLLQQRNSLFTVSRTK